VRKRKFDKEEEYFLKVILGERLRLLPARLKGMPFIIIYSE
jgi:hypothetical protein